MSSNPSRLRRVRDAHLDDLQCTLGQGAAFQDADLEIETAEQALISMKLKQELKDEELKAAKAAEAKAKAEITAVPVLVAPAAASPAVVVAEAPKTDVVPMTDKPSEPAKVDAVPAPIAAPVPVAIAVKPIEVPASVITTPLPVQPTVAPAVAAVPAVAPAPAPLFKKTDITNMVNQCRKMAEKAEKDVAKGSTLISLRYQGIPQRLPETFFKRYPETTVISYGGKTMALKDLRVIATTNVCAKDAAIAIAVGPEVDKMFVELAEAKLKAAEDAKAAKAAKVKAAAEAEAKAQAKAAKSAADEKKKADSTESEKEDTDGDDDTPVNEPPAKRARLSEPEIRGVLKAVGAVITKPGIGEELAREMVQRMNARNSAAGAADAESAAQRICQSLLDMLNSDKRGVKRFRKLLDHAETHDAITRADEVTRAEFAKSKRGGSL